MEIGRYLVLGTGHIRCSTARLLAEWAALPASSQPLAVASTQCGWFIATGYEPEGGDRQIPGEMRALIHFGRAQGCGYILLDSDGPEEIFLPLFPW